MDHETERYGRLIMEETKFVVAFINFYDNELHQEIVMATDWKEALHKCVHTQHFDFSECVTIEDYKSFAFDCDCMISVIGI